MANIEKLNELDKLLREEYGESIIFDGITDLEKYNSAPVKILWILKEADYKNPVEWNQRDFHNRDISKEYNNWRRTYALIIKVSYAILNNKNNYKDVPNEDKEINILKKIAIINVKKFGGSSSAIQKEINTIYKKHSDIIRQQIEYINPTIIINGSRVYKIMEDLKKESIVRKNRFEAIRFSNGIFVNAYHPNQRQITHEKYFNNIMEYIKCTVQ